MKKTKPKSSKKVAKSTAKASPKKAAKKELEQGIAEKFLDVVLKVEKWIQLLINNKHQVADGFDRGILYQD